MTLERAELRFRVGAFAAQGPDNPAFRVRALLPAAALARLGIGLEPRPLFGREEEASFRGGGPLQRVTTVSAARRRLLGALRAGERFDVTLIQRQVDMHPSLALERTAADAAGRLVWDVDDAIWRDTRSAGSHPLALLKGTRRKLRWLGDRADQVIAGNRILAERLSQWSERIEVVPSLVDTRSYTPRSHGQGGEVVLGWIGSPPTSAYLGALEPLLRSLPDALPGVRVRLLTVGATPGTLAAAPPGVEVEERRWSVSHEIEALEEMDIGLMPLPDNEWTRGKCAYKALLYMAAGIPVVADDVGVVRETVGDGGLIVSGRRQWLEAISELARDAGLRSRLGAAGRSRSERDYSLERWAPLLASLITGEERAVSAAGPAPEAAGA